MTMPVDFTLLLTVAGLIPLVMIVLYRVWPLLLGQEVVDWVYCIPFVAFGAGMAGVAVGVYLQPFADFISNRGSQALVLIIIVEIVTVFLVSQEIDAAEKRADEDTDNGNSETNA